METLGILLEKQEVVEVLEIVRVVIDEVVVLLQVQHTQHGEAFLVKNKF